MLNPIAYTEKIVSDFLKYQLTTYPFSDGDLYEQMRSLLNLEETRATPLMKGPYISLSRSFRNGAAISELVTEGVLHPHMTNLIPYCNVFGHQESAIRKVVAGKTTLVSTGTGSGKTECFLYPIISHCLKLRDENAGPGITAVIVYPMNALAEDQLGRLRELLAGTGVSFGMYIGKTPERNADVAGVRLSQGASREDYAKKLVSMRADKEDRNVHPFEERVSREEMRTSGMQPRILLTNVKQLELLLTRQHDVEMFKDARLDFLVFDEAHTFSGAMGAETACLIRRLRYFCGKRPDETVCVATSATIADPKGGPDATQASRNFASRFFGVGGESVEIVGEEYQPDQWVEDRSASSALQGSPSVHLQNILEALGEIEQEDPPSESIKLLRSAFQSMTGAKLDFENWAEQLYDYLAANETVFQIADALTEPQHMATLASELSTRLDRPIPEEEILTWLALGAASRKDGRPLVRPVVHCFVRGISGAVVTFPEGADRPRLWLSAEDVSDDSNNGLFRLPVMTCTTCGQHYYSHHVKDFHFTEEDKLPGGGDAVGDGRVWEALEPAQGGRRVVLVDRLVMDSESNYDSLEDHKRTATVFMCRYCGALHPEKRGRCDVCGREAEPAGLYAVKQKSKNPGYLSSCLACASIGHRLTGIYREPAKPVRALTVSDVHVLGQNMIQHAERKRLLIFADNRQDAAFQAGWMQDHARRFRLRSLMYERIEQGPVSIGDLTIWLDNYLDKDDSLSKALLPEVWRVARKERGGASLAHVEERKYFLRIQVLRELTTGMKQRIGLEPWGRIQVDYIGLDPDQAFFSNWSEEIGCEPDLLRDGVAGLLDQARRNRILFDPEKKIFSKYWRDGDREVQRGYIPLYQGSPKGLKVQRDSDDQDSYVSQWLSQRGDTAARQAALSWGVPSNDLDRFFDELWTLLTETLHILRPAILMGSGGGALPHCANVKQIDADRILIVPHKGGFLCNTCRRLHTRSSPKDKCLTFRCKGELRFVEESSDDYDLMVLDKKFDMVRPREHSAQIPASTRESIEIRFKGDGQQINTLVCTPTLELGVNIGSLDAVLMRNIPPLAANYWQRAGRAGRQFRMAVNISYARPASHDRAYFADPRKMLDGRILPPSFNLKNDLMVRKHVHATLFTALYQMAADEESFSEADRNEINETLKTCLPARISSYLFDERGHVRHEPLDVSCLTTTVSKHHVRLFDVVKEAFETCWPLSDHEAVQDENLKSYISEMGKQLAYVADTLSKRLNWAIDQMNRLEQVRRTKGTLDYEEQALYYRCDRLVKKLKGIKGRSRGEAEGFDDTYTFGVLAAEGFLPGYGLDTGTVVGYHLAPRYASGLKDWELRRGLALALREYVPGNMIYANGHRFLPRFYHLEPVEPTHFQLDIQNEAVTEIGQGSSEVSAGLGNQTLHCVPICDVDLPHQSHISDEEDYRFQMGVAVFGYEQQRHDGGKQWRWGPKNLTLRKAIRLRLVNVGPASKVGSKGELGYPICRVCGQSRSPLASDADLKKFREDHQERCGSKPADVGFYADVTSDAICLKDCDNRTEAYSIMETLRKAAAEVIEMEVQDLQLLCIGHSGEESVDILLYDPMPGGSGLLEQIIGRWEEVVERSLALVETCSSQCQSSCIDCLQHFRNSFYHRYLNRHVAIQRLKEWEGKLTLSHDIPPLLPAVDDPLGPVNSNEHSLKAMLDKAGFSGYAMNKPIDLGRPLGRTLPDFYFDDPNDIKDGICIYLDGMSSSLHGNPETARMDRQIREELRSRYYEVIEITRGQLDDRDAMQRHFFRLGRLLLDRDQAQTIRDDMTWYDASGDADTWTFSRLLQEDAPTEAFRIFVEVDETPDPEGGTYTCEPMTASITDIQDGSLVLVKHPQLMRGQDRVPIAMGKWAAREMRDSTTGEQRYRVYLRGIIPPAQLDLSIEERETFRPLGIVMRVEN